MFLQIFRKRIKEHKAAHRKSHLQKWVADWSYATVLHVAQHVLSKLYDRRIFGWTYCLFWTWKCGAFKEDASLSSLEGENNGERLVLLEHVRPKQGIWVSLCLGSIGSAKRSGLVALSFRKHEEHLLMFHNLLSEAKTYGWEGPWRESSCLACNCMSCLVTISLVSDRHLLILCLGTLSRKTGVMTTVC